MARHLSLVPSEAPPVRRYTDAEIEAQRQRWERSCRVTIEAQRQQDAEGALLRAMRSGDEDLVMVVDGRPVGELLAMAEAMETVPVLEARPCFWCGGTDGQGCAECFVDGGKVG